MRDITMEELKLIIGRNLTDLRHRRGMTQSEMAEKLNYSDKAVSKWECGDAVPDILILARIADLFGVTVNYLLEEEHTPADSPAPKGRCRVRTISTLLSMALVWLVATLAFVVMAMIPYTGEVAALLEHSWLVFIWAIPLSALVAYILSCVWHRRFMQYSMFTVMSWGTLLSAFLSLVILAPDLIQNPWLIFVLGIPVQVMIALWPGLKNRFKKVTAR